jgi:hypothetical protein
MKSSEAPRHRSWARDGPYGRSLGLSGGLAGVCYASFCTTKWLKIGREFMLRRSRKRTAHSHIYQIGSRMPIDSWILGDECSNLAGLLNGMKGHVIVFE